MWCARKVRRYPVPAAAYLTLLVGLIAAALLSGGEQPYAPLLWTAAGLLAVAGCFAVAIGFTGFLIKDARHELELIQLSFRRRMEQAEKNLRDEREAREALSPERDNVTKGLEARMAVLERSLRSAEEATSTLGAKVAGLESAEATASKLLRQRVTATENQIGEIRYPNSPACIVLFGHHKCGSRFLREELFMRVAEVTQRRVRRYKVTDPPFHYFRSDDLDLSNIDFSGLGEGGRDVVVLFSNATRRSLDSIRSSTSDWKGIRAIRDPRQVLVSDDLHHRGDHLAEATELGWVWDRLVEDKPILRELPEEEGFGSTSWITSRRRSSRISCWNRSTTSAFSRSSWRTCHENREPFWSGRCAPRGARHRRG